MAQSDISAAIDDSVDPKITYKNNLIVLNEETKNILVSRYLYSLSDKSVTLKINCMGNYRVFNSEEIKELIFK